MSDTVAARTTAPVSAWDELVTAALLGTERRTLPVDLPEPVGRLARARDLFARLYARASREDKG